MVFSQKLNFLGDWEAGSGHETICLPRPDHVSWMTEGLSRHMYAYLPPVLALLAVPKVLVRCTALAEEPANRKTNSRVYKVN